MLRVTERSAMLVYIVVTLFSCEPNTKSFQIGGSSDSVPDANPDTGSNTDDDTDNGSGNDTDEGHGTSGDSDAGGGNSNICDEQNFPVEATPVKFLILQDISGSMTDGKPNTKWNVAKTAMSQMLNTYGAMLDFGFDAFPNNGFCGVHQPLIADSLPNNAQNIIQQMNTIQPDGSTPLYCALKKFTNLSYAPEFLSAGATSYLLVVTDGEDTCGSQCSPPFSSSATAAELSDITTQLCSSGVQTFAVGFGNGVSPAQLNAIAKNGCTGMTSYLIANNQAELEQALDSLASSVASCIYELGEVDEDADPEETNFYFDGDQIGYDENCAQDTGWTWTDDTYTKVEFCKESCDKLQDGLVSNISATFGCPTIPVR